MATSTSIKLRAGLRERIKTLAESRDVTANQIMNEAVREYVEREEKRIAIIDRARERWAHYVLTGERITLEEAEEWLDVLLDVDDLVVPPHP